jgi:hypothetical protein
MAKHEADKLVDKVMKLPRPKSYGSWPDEEYRANVAQALQDLTHLAIDCGSNAASWAILQFDAFPFEPAEEPNL